MMVLNNQLVQIGYMCSVVLKLHTSENMTIKMQSGAKALPRYTHHTKELLPLMDF